MSHSGRGAIPGQRQFMSMSGAKIYHHVVSGSENCRVAGRYHTATGMRIRARRNTSGDLQQVEYSTDGGTIGPSLRGRITGSSSTQYPFAEYSARPG